MKHKLHLIPVGTLFLAILYLVFLFQGGAKSQAEADARAAKEATDG